MPLFVLVPDLPSLAFSGSNDHNPFSQPRLAIACHALQTLAAARKLRTPDNLTKIMDVNPKSIKTEELYGFISMATREWKDGLLSKASSAMFEPIAQPQQISRQTPNPSDGHCLEMKMILPIFLCLF